MPWFRVDDGFASHPKVRAIPRAHRMAAIGVWTACGLWSTKHLTDGLIPADVVEDEGGRQADADRLVAAGLWHADGHSCPDCPQPGERAYQFHGWGDYQPTRDKVLAERAATAARVRRHRATRNGTSAPVTNGDRNADTPPVSTVPPGPARPVPITNNPPHPSGEVPPAPKRGTRIPDDYRPDDGLVAWVRAHCPDVPSSEHDRFVDHWRAQPGAKGVKLDWDATWRNWMRRAHDDIRAGRRPGAAGATRRPSTTDARVAAGLELADRYEAEDGGTVLALPLGGSA